MEQSRYSHLILSITAFNLSGCAYTGIEQHTAPAAELQKVEGMVREVMEVRESDMSYVCSSHSRDQFLLGCYSPAENTIYLLRNMDKTTRLAVYQHELGHVYDLRVLGKTLRESAAHEGWR